MANMSLVKNPMPEQEPNIRNGNFEEVALGYSDEQAVDEAQRCLNCKHKPCMKGCPVAIDIPGFVDAVAKGDNALAYEIIARTSALPAICGRVCPQETQCEELCVRGIKGDPVGIGRLERYVADWFMKSGRKAGQTIEKNGHRVAVVGSGPAGLTCAGDLARMGYDVTIFEALHVPGGVLMYGIPEFRLPKAIVQREIDGLRDMGVKIECNMVIGKADSVDELFEQGFEAVFVGSGAGLPTFMKIPGENLKGVYSANEFLTRVNLMKAYLEGTDTPVKPMSKVAVVGGGNVAMDVARCAKRLGADEVYIVYRRSDAELPARAEEVHHAKEEGIIFHLLTNPVAILGDEKQNVTAIRCVKMELGEPDERGRRRPKVIEGSEFELPVDAVMMSIGTSPNPLIRTTTKGLDCHDWGGIIADDTGKTSRDGVYAGGDAVTGAATVILAMGAGKAAATAMDEYICSL